MYNEIDRLILDSIVRCSFCNGKSVKCKDLTTTIAAKGPGPEESFRDRYAYHEHDFNRMDASYYCNDCRQTFIIEPLNACWCGWSAIPLKTPRQV